MYSLVVRSQHDVRSFGTGYNGPGKRESFGCTQHDCMYRALDESFDQSVFSSNSAIEFVRGLKKHRQTA